MSVPCQHIVRPSFDPLSWKLAHQLLLPWWIFTPIFFCTFLFSS